MKDRELKLGDYSYRDKKSVVSAISASTIHLLQLNLSDDTCDLELTSVPLTEYDEVVHKEQWGILVQKIWLIRTPNVDHFEC